MAAQTVRTLIRKSLETIGARAAGEPVSDADAQYCLELLNDMLDAWKAESLTIYVVERSIFPLTAGQGSPSNPYTIGPGGDFDRQRPLWIQDAGVISNYGSANEFELPLNVLSTDQYARLGVKRVPSSLPTQLYYDYAFEIDDGVGLGRIFFWPVPNVAGLRVALYIPTAREEFEDLDEEVIFPPGYREALHYNLATRLCPGFARPVDAKAEDLAVKALARVERVNNRILELACDPALLSTNRGTWNWLTSDTGRSA